MRLMSHDLPRPKSIAIVSAACLSLHPSVCLPVHPLTFSTLYRPLYFIKSKVIPWIDIFSISCEMAIRGMPQDCTDNYSTLIQVMMATSHYLSESWPRSMSPYGVMGHNELTESHMILLIFLWTLVPYSNDRLAIPILGTMLSTNWLFWW